MTTHGDHDVREDTKITTQVRLINSSDNPALTVMYF